MTQNKDIEDPWYWQSQAKIRQRSFRFLAESLRTPQPEGSSPVSDAPHPIWGPARRPARPAQ